MAHGSQKHLRWEPAALVAHAQLDGAIDRVRRQRDNALPVAERIVDQVPECLLQPKAITAEPERLRVMAIRTGERSFAEAIAEIDEVEQRLAQALERTPLPPEPDREAVDSFLVDAYRRAWGW